MGVPAVVAGSPEKEKVMSEPTCALWYWSHGSVFVELCDDEQEAAESACSLSDSEQGAPAGIQYSDGSYLDTENWPAYEAERERRYEADMEWAREAATKPQPARREVTPPFETRYSQKTKVPADAPSWLGRQVTRLSGQ